jgi:hypothetical protein
MNLPLFRLNSSIVDQFLRYREISFDFSCGSESIYDVLQIIFNSDILVDYYFQIQLFSCDLNFLSKVAKSDVSSSRVAFICVYVQFADDDYSMNPFAHDDGLAWETLWVIDQLLFRFLWLFLSS